jgi:hypothetical protein
MNVGHREWPPLSLHTALQCVSKSLQENVKEEKHKKCRVKNTEPDLDYDLDGPSPAPRHH